MQNSKSIGLIPVRVRPSPPAPNQYNPNQIFPAGDGFGLFVFFERFEETHFRNGVVKRAESKPRGSRKKKRIWIAGVRLPDSSFLLFEKRYHDSAGTCMGSDYASYGRVADFLQAAFPNVTAVLNIFQQQRVRDPTIAKQNRPAEINAAGLINLLNEQIVSHLRAARFSQQVDLTVNDGKHRLDIQHPSGECGCL